MLTLHPMKEKDLPQVAAIEASIFSQPWSEKGFLDALRQKAAFYLVAAEEEKILGYCGFYQSFDEADITNVAVRESERGRGMARAMLDGTFKRRKKQRRRSFYAGSPGEQRACHPSLRKIRLYLGGHSQKFL